MPLRRSFVVTLVLLVLSSFACGGDPPDKEIQQAQNALDQARAAGADRYAVEEYTNIKHVMADLSGEARKGWHFTVYGDQA